MQAVANNTVTGLQKRIVRALETGQDPAPLLKELGELRAKIAAQGELAELQKIASERQAIKDKAEAVKAKVEAQSSGIDRFLTLRDTLVSQLQPLLEPMNELAKMAASTWEREPGACYSGFNDMGQFAGAVRQVPAGYLPPNFGCPFLEMIGGEVDARDKARDAYAYLQYAHGILASFQKGLSVLPLRGAEGLMAVDNEPEAIPTEADPYPDPPCGICKHPEREAIDKALQNGRSLRDIEAEFGTSRSSLSRHKQHIAVTVSQEA